MKNSIITTENYMAEIENDSRYNAYGNFLDCFYYSMNNDERAEAIAKRPVGEDRHPVDAAKLAATVERLCSIYGLDVPEWVCDECYILEEPFYGDPAPKSFSYMKLLRESALPEFAKRNIFLGDNCMDRA